MDHNLSSFEIQSNSGPVKQPFFTIPHNKRDQISKTMIARGEMGHDNNIYHSMAIIPVSLLIQHLFTEPVIVDFPTSYKES